MGLGQCGGRDYARSRAQGVGFSVRKEGDRMFSNYDPHSNGLVFLPKNRAERSGILRRMPRGSAWTSPCIRGP